MGLSLSRISSRSVCLSVLALAISVLSFSQNQKPIIDNAKVRVLRITIKPGETTTIDHPELNRVVVWLQQGSGKSISANGLESTISWKKNEARWEPAGSSHSMKSEGNATVSAIVVELKAKGRGQNTTTSPQNPWLVDPKHYRLDFENNDVRVTRVKIDPKDSTPLHEHSLNRVVIYLSPMDFQIGPEGKPSQHSVQKAGAIVWGDPVRHTEHNLSDKPFEAVVIEPKY